MGIVYMGKLSSLRLQRMSIFVQHDMVFNTTKKLHPYDFYVKGSGSRLNDVIFCMVKFSLESLHGAV